MADIFALEKGAVGAAKRLLTSHNTQTKLKLDGQDIRMVQDANAQYQQRTDAKFEVGFENLYWAVGQSQGTLTCNKLIAQSDVTGGGMWEGMVEAMKDGGSNGDAAITFDLETENGSLTGDCVIQQASAGFNVGGMAIQDNTVWSIGNLEKS
jgi:hypothetical protein